MAINTDIKKRESSKKQPKFIPQGTIKNENKLSPSEQKKMTIGYISERKSCFVEKVNKIDKTLTGVTQNKRGRAQ